MSDIQLDTPPSKIIYTRPEHTLEEAREWILHHPEAHKPYTHRQEDGMEIWKDVDGKTVKRNVTRERDQIHFFLNQIKTADPRHYELLVELSHKLPEMRNDTRVSVNIPAWMEARNLYGLLQEYTYQTDAENNPLDPSLYEINILINRMTGDKPDSSTSEINRFISESKLAGKEFQIHYIDLEFDPPFNNVGNARRVINNVTLLRSIQRSQQDAPLYFESEDADLLQIDQHTIINLINKFDKYPHLDAILGIQDRSPEILMQNDYLFLYRRLDDFRKLIQARPRYGVGDNPNANFLWNRTFTGGWNTGITAEAYALIGGYDPLMAWGEDLVIGVRLSMARGTNLLPNTQVIGRTTSRTDASPRRFIYAIAIDDATYGDNFMDTKINKAIRNESIPKLLRKIEHVASISESNANIFQQLLNFHFNFILQHTPKKEDAIKDMKLILLFLGFKPGDYSISAEQKITVSNYANVKNALNEYRREHDSTSTPRERPSSPE